MSAEHEIVVCMGSSCFARGNNANLELIERFLEEQSLHVTVRLCGSRCEDCCAEGPNVRIDGKLYHHVDRGMLLDLLREHLNIPVER